MTYSWLLRWDRDKEPNGECYRTDGAASNVGKPTPSRSLIVVLEAIAGVPHDAKQTCRRA